MDQIEQCRRCAKKRAISIHQQFRRGTFRKSWDTHLISCEIFRDVIDKWPSLLRPDKRGIICTQRLWGRVLIRLTNCGVNLKRFLTRTWWRLRSTGFRSEFSAASGIAARQAHCNYTGTSGMLITSPMPEKLNVKPHEMCEHFVNEHNDEEWCDTSDWHQITASLRHVSSSASWDKSDITTFPHNKNKTGFIRIEHPFVWIKDSSGSFSQMRLDLESSEPWGSVLPQ